MFRRLFGINNKTERRTKSEERDATFRLKYEGQQLECLPGLVDKVDGAMVTELFVRQGEKLSAGQAIIEAETDKAALEVPVDRDIEIVAMAVSEKDWIMPGQVLAAVKLLAGSE